MTSGPSNGRCRLCSGDRSPPHRPPRRIEAIATLRLVAPGAAQHAAGWLDSLAAAGASAASLALVLDAIADDRERRTCVDDAIDLVSTGPETPAAANRDTRVVVSELFAAACTSVLVVGYAVYNGRQVFRALAERMDQRPELDVRMFLDVQRPWRDTTLPEELLRRFAQRFRTEEWPGSRRPRMFYDPRSLSLDAKQRASLHAKCIVVDGHTSFVSPRISRRPRSSGTSKSAWSSARGRERSGSRRTSMRSRPEG